VLLTPVGRVPEVVRDLSSEKALPTSGTMSLVEGLVAALVGELVLSSTEVCQAHARARYGRPTIAGLVRNVYSEVIS